MQELNYQQKSIDISEWIKNTVHDAGFTDVVIAVSGGIDSAVALFLAVKALGPEHVHALLLPYGSMSDQHTTDAKEVVEKAGLSPSNMHVFDIASSVNALLDETHEKDKIRKGNIMARMRMIYIYDMSKKLNALVIGTENKTEYYLGYFTRFGDEASDIEPIRNLYKTQVFAMGKTLGVPGNIITKAPTAGLWEDQTDEKEFGFSYQDADRILYHYFEEKLPLEGIVGLGFAKPLVEKVLERVEQNDFKHHLPHIFS